MEKQSAVIMALADHLSGEAVGAAMEDILALGAAGVSAVSAIAKKNRPAVILFIEPGAVEEEVREYLARELKIGGYQKFNTSHVFMESRFVEKKAVIKVDGKEETYHLRVKVAGPEGAALFTSVESDDALRICSELELKHGIVRPVHVIKGLLEACLSSPEEQAVINL